MEIVFSLFGSTCSSHHDLKSLPSRIEKISDLSLLSCWINAGTHILSYFYGKEAEVLFELCSHWASYTKRFKKCCSDLCPHRKELSLGLWEFQKPRSLTLALQNERLGRVSSIYTKMTLQPREVMFLAQGHSQPRLDQMYSILSLLCERKEVKRAVTIPREIERVFPAQS